MNSPSDSYALPYPHDPIEQIADDLFMVRGSIKMNPLMRITRNMAIVRYGDSLTLVNPMRLNAAGEAALKALGSVDRILRLGPFHGIDDPYYVEQLNAEFWCRSGGKTYTRPKIDTEISGNCELPFPDAELIHFEKTKQPESMLLLKRGRGMLLTCDAIQHYGDYRHNTLLARIMMPLIGFPKTTIIGPLWLKYMADEPDTLRAEFEQLLGYEFDGLLSAHGSFLETGAKAAVKRAIEKTFQ